MKKIICNTKFQLNPFGDGGSKRSVQIRHLYEEYGFQIEEDAFLLPKGLRFFELLKLSFRSIRFIHKHYPFKIHKPWIEDHDQFVAWALKNGFNNPDLVIERIDKTKDFEPSNLKIVEVE